METNTKVMVVCLGEARFSAKPDALAEALYFHFVEGLGGAWTEFRSGREHILFGWPGDSKEQWFRVLDAPGGKLHNAATQALERIIFARSINHILIADQQLAAVVERGAKVHPGVELIVKSENQSDEEFVAAVQSPKTGVSH